MAEGGGEIMDPNLFVVFLATVTLTSYQPRPEQTRPGCQGIHNCFTSVGDIPTKYGAAASPDLLKSGALHYGDAIYVENYGWRIINDVMAKKNHNAIDLMVWSYQEEHSVGVQHRRIWTVKRR